MLYKVKARLIQEKMKDFLKVLTNGSVEQQEPDGAFILKAMKEAKLVGNDTYSMV